MASEYISYTEANMGRATSRQTGFTIVELLIVIVVIAILVAITIVAYNGIQQRAQSTVLSSDLANAARQMELAKVDAADGLYPAIPSTVKPSSGICAAVSADSIERHILYECLPRLAVFGVIV